MKAPYKLGLTGSIGMGKSTTAGMFAALGVPVWDADGAVHRLYAPGGAAVAPLAAAFPSALVDDGIDRNVLKAIIAADPAAIARLEQIVHPLVAADRAAFLDRTVKEGAEVVVLDVPLLYELGNDAQMDGVAVVSASAMVQRQRVMARPGMTEEQFALILSRQMPDAEKRARATWVIETTTLEAAETQMKQVLSDIRSRIAHA